MLIDKKIIKAKFIHRPNRFKAFVAINGEETMVHVPNTGRCREILIPGTEVILREETNENRKTKYDLIAAYKNDEIISIDSMLPNKVVEEALLGGRIEGLARYTRVQREKTWGASRFDFRLEDKDNNPYYLEVKGVTLEQDGIAMFPDAPTERGTKHLLELINVKENDHGAGVLFLVQMKSVKSFTPNVKMDNLFGEALKKATQNGVDVFAYNCNVGEDFITLCRQLPVIL